MGNTYSSTSDHIARLVAAAPTLDSAQCAVIVGSIGAYITATPKTGEAA